MPAQYDYRKPFEKEQVHVGFVVGQGVDGYDHLPSQIEDLAARYNFTYLPDTDRCLTKYERDNIRLRHLIIVQKAEDNPDKLTKRVLGEYPDFDTYTLALCYDSEESCVRSGGVIDRIKQNFGGFINYLRPTYCDLRKGYYPDPQKLADNAVCDTVRIKYVPEYTESNITRLVAANGSYFEECSALYREQELYHRSPTNGFFAVRTGEEAFLITATKTNKSELDLGRISLVHSYDPASNILTYSGNFLPSSDAVEAATVFKNLRDVGCLIHTHASRQFTRNPAYRHKVPVPQLPYGEEKLGHVVCSALNSEGLNNFIIMEDHGEVFAGARSTSPEDAVKLFSEMCCEAARTNSAMVEEVL